MIPPGRGSGLLATTACRLAESVASSLPDESRRRSHPMAMDPAMTTTTPRERERLSSAAGLAGVFRGRVDDGRMGRDGQGILRSLTQGDVATARFMHTSRAGF